MIEQKLKYIANKLGWKTKRKIVVFESDDWGSNRMPSAEAYNMLKEKNIVFDDSAAHFYKYDTLESNDDLIKLFEVLSSFKDFNGNHPIFTAVNVVANPDFEKIKESNYEKYYYELFTDTAKRYKGKDKILELWKEGREKKIFEPQFHGREHLNVAAWMDALKTSKEKTRIAFDNYVYGINSQRIGESTISYLAAFDVLNKEEITMQNEILIDGINIFYKLLGYKPQLFVPPNGPFNLTHTKTLHKCGIKYIVLDRFQREPQGNGKYRYRLRLFGSKNKYGQIFISRNVGFEPADNNYVSVTNTINQIASAFRFKIPAIIGTHRVNYAGSLKLKNRDNGLNQLKQLIENILRLWPDVEFMTSVEMVKTMLREK